MADMRPEFTSIYIPFLSTGLRQVKRSLYRPLGLQEVEAPRIFRQSAHKGGKVVSPTDRSPLLPRYHWYSFLLEAESTPGPYGGRKD